MSCTVPSSVQYADVPVVESNQELRIIPCRYGNEPVPIVEWPAHVTVFRYG